MKRIKFSHEYHKMPLNYTPSRLIQTLLIDRSEMSDQFVAYDTLNLNDEMYKLPKGKLIVLLLLTTDRCLWTTIRRYTQSKWDYYHSQIGVLFDIVVGDEQ